VRAALLALLLLPAQSALDDALDAVPAGVVVVVGSLDPLLPAKIASNGRRIVHVLSPDAAGVETARKLASDSAGLVTVEAWTDLALPYAADTVNLAIVGAPIPEPELLRVLAPGGTAMILKGGKWSALRKPRPEGFDEWTHWRHGADGNMVSKDRAVAAPTGLRWVAGPPTDAGGRKWYYDHVLLTSNGRNVYVYEDSIVARDSWNGALLWTRPFKAYTFKETGLPLPETPPAKARLGVRVSKVRPVLVADRLFAATDGKLLEIDARTGATAAEFSDVREPREVVVDGGLLLVTEPAAIRAFSLETRKPAWEAPLAAKRVVAGDGSLFVLTETHVIGLDRATGREKWRTADEHAARAVTCTYQDGRLVLEKSTWRDDPIGIGIRVYDTQTGELAWTRDYQPDMTHYREARAYFARGLLWIQIDKERLLGLDPRSGSERQTWKTRGKHCATPVASERFFMAPECEFTDLETGAQSRTRMFKSACRLPFIPANGVLYTFPVQCECWPMLRGYMALASGPTASLAAGPRRVEGPTAPAAALLLPAAERADEWPTYRHDALRSQSTPMKAPAVPRVVWEARLASLPRGPAASDWSGNPFVDGVLTAPVAAGGLVFVSAPDLHRVLAIDAKTGERRWTFQAGGRVDGPPTVAAGLCLFGAHDGWIYAVRAATGELAWRLRAAPAESRVMAYGQMESPWPVVGSVLVDGGLAYAAAGRHPSCDGGVRVLAFRPATGELVWEKSVDQIEEVKKWYGGTLPGTAPPAVAGKPAPRDVKIGVDFEPVDLLVRDGDRVSMSRWRFDPQNGDFKMEMGNVTYPGPGGRPVPRGLWGYGIRQTKLLLPKPAAAFDAERIHVGGKADLAVLLAGGTVVSAGATELKAGEHAVPLPAEPVPDGLIGAYGRLYVATQAGTVLCLE
jgi:outer membrane protein assembly factor BamB